MRENACLSSYSNDTPAFFYSGSMFNTAWGPIWLANLHCTGSEENLAACVHSNWGKHQCSHQQDVYVACGKNLFWFRIELHSCRRNWFFTVSKGGSNGNNCVLLVNKYLLRITNAVMREIVDLGNIKCLHKAYFSVCYTAQKYRNGLTIIVYNIVCYG